MNQERLDLNKLTIEAEVGHGTCVKKIMDSLSFQDRIHTLRKMQNISHHHHSLEPDDPYVTFSIWADTHGYKEGYACLTLDRRVPHKSFFGLLDRSDALYVDYLDLYNGNEAVVETNITNDSFSGGAHWPIQLPWNW